MIYTWNILLDERKLHFKQTFFFNSFQNGDTPLHVAVRYNNYQVAKMLRKEGAKVDKVNNVCCIQVLFPSCRKLQILCYMINETKITSTFFFFIFLFL